MVAKGLVELLSRKTYRPPAERDDLAAEIKDALSEEPADLARLHTLASAALEMIHKETSSKDLDTTYDPWVGVLGNYAAQCLYKVTGSPENW